jgi:uncharacterized membrane protein
MYSGHTEWHASAVPGCQIIEYYYEKRVRSYLVIRKMPSISLGVVFAIATLLPLVSLGAGSLDFNETILNLEEGSTLNYSIVVESLQSIIACITKNSSVSYEDFDLSTSLSIGECAVCDSGQNCAHQFNSSAINVMINRPQNDSIQLVTFFKENISLDDNGTKIICAYEAGNTTMPCSWIYLDVHFLPKPENPIRFNILVPVAVSSSAVVALFIILLIVIIFTVRIIFRHKRGELMPRSSSINRLLL